MDNAVGIWWAEVFGRFVYIGVVVPEMMHMRNTIIVGND